MTEQIKALGPLGLPRKFAEWDREVIALAREVRDREAAAGPCPARASTPEPLEAVHA